MAKIISHYSGTNSLAKRIWRNFLQLDRFTKLAVITMLLLVIVTPLTISTRFIFKNQAADIAYVASAGIGKDSIFTLSDINTTTDEGNTVIIKWTTSTPSKSELKYWENTYWSSFLAYFWQNQLKETDYVTDHELHLTENLSAHSEYTFSVTMTTKFGDTFETPKHTFKTL